MKKLIFVAILLLSFSVLKAQLNFGLKAGYNSSLSVSNIASVLDGTYGVDNVKSEMWNNFQAGAFARVFIKKLYIEPAILYSLEKKNYSISLTDLQSGAVDPNNFVDVKTINVPIMLGLKLLDLKIANLRVFGGPKLQFDAGTTPQVVINDVVGEVKKAALGFQAGAGVDVLMFALDLHYNFAGSMFDAGVSNVKFEPTQTFVVSLGWKLF